MLLPLLVELVQPPFQLPLELSPKPFNKSSSVLIKSSSSGFLSSVVGVVFVLPLLFPLLLFQLSIGI
ncbi:MAG: hypothetical protein LBC61_02190 [Candidatus Peribacteria bacterium]|nr:hypothetical protein [Candidatus Peribacteria bacterium]